MTAALIVNDSPIADETIATELQRLMRAGAEHLPADELRKNLPAIKQLAKDMAINRQLLLAEARRRLIEVPEDEVDNILVNLSRPYGDRANFELHLKNINSSPEIVRCDIRRARQVEKLTSLITSAVPDPTDEEVLSCLKDYAPAGNCDPQKPELMRQLISKTRVLLRRLRQNQALTGFIAELRKKAVIKD